MTDDEVAQPLVFVHLSDLHFTAGNGGLAERTAVLRTSWKPIYERSLSTLNEGPLLLCW